MQKHHYELKILAIFIISLIAYLAIAWLVLEPMGYYGTKEQPRFADPWIARAETILEGGQLYTDVFTTTPPLMNYLLIPPTIVSGWLGHQNPGSTTAFMIYFSVFNLLIAFVLYYSTSNRSKGYQWALLYLLNPLTFGNTVLRRQDESVLVFFFALTVLFLRQDKYVNSAVAMGVSLLVKVTGGLLIPAAFVTQRKWIFITVPFIVFGLVFLPFYIQAGESAIFWDVTQEHTEHPFQIGGVSLGSLWLRWQGGNATDILTVYSVVFIIGVVLILAYLAVKPQDYVANLAFLVAGVLLLSPKLHCGYYSILVFSLTPLMRQKRLIISSFAFAGLALFADMYKWPVENFQVAWWLMLGVQILIMLIMVWVRCEGTPSEGIIQAYRKRRKTTL